MSLAAIQITLLVGLSFVAAAHDDLSMDQLQDPLRHKVSSILLSTIVNHLSAPDIMSLQRSATYLSSHIKERFSLERSVLTNPNSTGFAIRRAFGKLHDVSITNPDAVIAPIL